MNRPDAEINAYLDTRVKLEAPAQFELGRGNAFTLDAGRLVADVPAQAIGFRVRTPAGDIVDLGTTFGVEVFDTMKTEVAVLSGKVRVAARSMQGGLSHFAELTDGNAARLDRATGQVARIDARADRFTMDYVRVIDLVDAVAGGDGTTGKRDAGISAQTSQLYDRPLKDQSWYLQGDSRFHASAAPLVAGVFIPVGGGGENRLDPAGHTFDQLTTVKPTTYGLIWAGGSVPVPKGDPPKSSVVDGVDYAQPGRGLVVMHANAGVCFDLAEVRRRNPGMSLARFHTDISNRDEGDRTGDPKPDRHASVDVYVFVDGEQRFVRKNLSRRDGVIEIDVPLDAGSNYLTLVVTDGLNDLWYDWVYLLRPRLELTLRN